MKIINSNKDTPIKPKDIDTKQHFFNSFEKMEREVSARACVSLAQKNKSWRAFSKAEIDKHWGENVWFNGLDSLGYIVLKKDKYYFTAEFIAKCYASSPA